MSRSGYSDDYDWDGGEWALIRWRGAVTSAIKGRRGQAFLKEMLATLDAMETKRLIAHNLVKEGEVCALGAVGVSRGVEMDHLDPEDRDTVSATFGIAPAMAAEIVYINDEEASSSETPEARYRRMRAWILSEIRT